jgi:hypothetical protein
MNINFSDDQIINQIILKPLSTIEDLKNWLLFFLDVDLADHTVSYFSTSNPLEMVWEIYNFCKDEKNIDPFSIYYIAGRSSQKTLSAAVLQILLPLHFKRGIVHLGGTKQQSQRAYEYFKKFVNRKYIKQFIKEDPTQHKTVFSIGGEDVEVEILSISPMSVQGPHQPVVSLDELGSLSPDKMKAYDDVSGIPVYTKTGQPWIKFGISSRHGKYTVIEEEYDKRDKSGVQFRFWTVFENTQKCPESISGKKDIEMYIDPIQNLTVSEEDFVNTPPEIASKLRKVQAKENCLTCPISGQCGGSLSRQTSTCRTLRPVQSVINQFKQAPSLEWWLSQSMSLTPSAEGLVFPKFKREIFEKTPKEIYEIFTGTYAPEGLTEQMLIDYMIQQDVKRYAGLDHGYTHPMAIVIIYEDSRNNAYIMASEERVGLEPSQVMDFVKEMWEKYKFTAMYPDNEAPAMNAMIRKARLFSVIDDFVKSVQNGITLIRGKISPTVGTTKMFGLKGKVNSLVDNFEKFHFKSGSDGEITDSVNDIFDDSIAALRYAAQNRWEKKGGIYSSGNNPNQAAPSPEELKILQQKALAEYQEKIKTHQSQWLTQEINKTVNESGGNSGVKSSKNKSIFWDID